MLLGDQHQKHSAALHASQTAPLPWSK
jgi:hypothetical protein